MRTAHHILTTAVLLLCIILNSKATSNIVYKFNIHDEIGPSISRLTEKAVAEAERQKAAFILIDLDTYGGLVDDADVIRTLLLKSPIPTVVLIRNNAASAGALISIACDSIYMMPGATIGAASVVNQAGELAPEKYQSYMRKKMRATAEQTGRNPLIAEGMTDESLAIDSIKEAGKIITFSTKEAIQYGYCNAEVNEVDDILTKLAGGPFQLVEHESSSVEAAILWLINPAVSGVLLLLIFGGIYFEFKMPGTFIPLGVSVVAAIMYFAPLYLEGLAANWEILVFIAGVILLLVELFILPGFGIAGISGIVLIVFSLTLALVRNINFDFSFVPSGSVANALLLVTVSMATPLILLLLFGQKLFSSGTFRAISAVSEMKTADGFTIKEAGLEELIGKSGVAITDLRPSGKIEIEDNWYDVIADSAFLAKGTNVRVIAIRSNYLVVDKS